MGRGAPALGARMRARVDEEVRAVCVRSCDPPQHVDEGAELGSLVYLEQCDGCGCSTYSVQVDGVRCVGDDYDEGEPVPGCGAFYPFHWVQASRVAF